MGQAVLEGRVELDGVVSAGAVRAPGEQDGSRKAMGDCSAEADWRTGLGQGGSWEGRKVDLQGVCFG